jgi:hypothetical protein
MPTEPTTTSRQPPLTIMIEEEAPTAPPTPDITPCASMSPQEASAPAVEAHKSQCAICHTSMHKVPALEKVKHLNKCWESLREAAKGKPKTLLQPKHSRKPLVTLGAHAGKNDDSSSSSSSKEPASTSAPPLPVSLDDLAKICLFCHANVANLDAVDALNHRLGCLQIKNPLSCPFCKESFLHPTPWRFSLKAIHLHTCNANVLALSHWDDFGKLTAALMTRGEVAKFLMRTKTGLKQKQRVKRYKARKDLGRSIGLGRYAMDFSELRWSHTLEGNKVEVGYVEENCDLWYRDLRDFRRSVYSVLDLDGSFDIPDDYKADIRSATLETLETPPKVFTSQQRPVQTSPTQLELLGVPSAIAEKTAEEVRRLLIPAIAEMSEEYEDDTEDEFDEIEVETDVDIATSTDGLPDTSFHTVAEPPQVAPSPPATEVYTIQDIVKNLGKPAASTTKTNKSDDADSDKAQREKLPARPYEPKRPDQLLALLKAPSVPAGKILKTTSFTLSDETPPTGKIRKTVSFTLAESNPPNPVTFPHTIKQFPNLRLTSLTEEEESPGTGNANGNVGQQTTTLNLMNGSPRHYPQFFTDPQVFIQRWPTRKRT